MRNCTAWMYWESRTAVKMISRMFCVSLKRALSEERTEGMRSVFLGFLELHYQTQMKHLAESVLRMWRENCQEMRS